MSIEEELKEKLWEKISSEYNHYEKEVLNLSKEEVYEKSYKTTIRKGIVNYFDPLYYEGDRKEIQMLLVEDDLLSSLYRAYARGDYDISEKLEESIKDVIFQIKEEKEKSINENKNLEKNLER